MRRILFLLPAVVVLLVTLSVGIPRDVSAHGALDQANDVNATGFGEIKGAAPAGQEFTPSVADLVAVDFNLSGCNSFAGDDTLTVRVRDATIGGTILGSTSQLVDANIVDKWEHFELSATLVPGQTYVIELEATKITHCGNLSGNSYAGGRLIAFGGPIANLDLLFKTYTQPSAVGGIVELRTDAGDAPSEISNSSSGGQAVQIMAAVAGAVTVLAAGGWYARRRWQQ